MWHVGLYFSPLLYNNRKLRWGRVDGVIDTLHCHYRPVINYTCVEVPGCLHPLSSCLYGDCMGQMQFYLSDYLLPSSGSTPVVPCVADKWIWNLELLWRNSMRCLTYSLVYRLDLRHSARECVFSVYTCGDIQSTLELPSHDVFLLLPLFFYQSHTERCNGSV